MTSANKRWTIFGRGWCKLVSIFFKWYFITVLITKRFQWNTNTYVGQKLKKIAQYIFYLHIFISWKKKREGGSALHIFSIFYTHHQILLLLFCRNKKNTLVEPFFNCLFTFTMECGADSNNAMSSRSSFTK
jgi:hypothetical protein